MKCLLSPVVFDVNMSFWGLHNHQVRKHIFQIGLNPNRLTVVARQTTDHVHIHLMLPSRSEKKGRNF